MERNNMENLQKDFLPYELSLKMKQLGFDEPCMYYVDEQNNSFIYNFQTHPDEFIEWCGVTVISTPLYQQAFRWFREEHDLHYQLVPFFSDKESYAVDYYLAIAQHRPPIQVNTFEEAELACLEKLIQIVKTHE
jgi:hypothetical protein